MPIAREPGSSEALLAIIVINFRTPALTIDCLHSLQPEMAAQPGVHVYLVENGSGDDSLEKIGAAIDRFGLGYWCTLLPSEKNRGFSGGNNFGIAAAGRAGGAKYYLLLNSDTLVQPGCLAHCIRTMDSNGRIGAMSCRVLNADGSIQNVCRKFPTPLRCLVAATLLPWTFPAWFSWADCDDPGWDRDQLARDVDWIGGAFMMLRGDWIAEHKALDDRFFFYGEDVELCHRVWKTGFHCRYDPASTITHLGGGSSDPSRMALGARSFHQWRGRYLIQAICYGIAAQFLLQTVDLLTVFRRLAWMRLTGRANTAGYAAMRGVRELLVQHWSTWSKRDT